MENSEISYHCCLLFGGEIEVEQLLIKLQCERDYIKYWFIVENSFDLKGNPKPLILDKVVYKDERFAEFANRLKIIQVTENYRLKYKRTLGSKCDRLIRGLLGRWSRKLENRWQQAPNFFAEFSQREACRDELLRHATDNDYVFVTDFDEVVNLENSRKRYLDDFIVNSRANFVGVGRIRFVFDYVNLQLGKWRTVPLLNVGALRAGTKKIFDSRLRDDFIPLNFTPIVFEYSFCLKRGDIIEKTKKFAHNTLDDISVVDRALSANHVLVRDFKKPLRSIVWCELTSIDDLDHPSFIKENYNKIKTDNISLNYKEYRKDIYHELFR